MISRGLTQLLPSATLLPASLALFLGLSFALSFGVASAQPTTSALTAASEPQNKESATLVERPSVKLLHAGISYLAPKTWTQEDYPQLNGVLILAPTQKDAVRRDAASSAKQKPKWRSRILVELAKVNDPNFDQLALTEATTFPNAGKVPLETKHKVIARDWVKHPRGFSYAIAEIEFNRDGELIREYRVVMNSASPGQRILITASASHAQWLVDKSIFETFFSTIGLRN